jgi:predicted transcriptional regulator
MAKLSFTLRIDQEERTALEHIGELEGRPIEQLLTEAIKSYLNQRGPRGASLEAGLSALQKHSASDPGFERAIAAFVDAEACLEDPIEGKSLEGRFVGREFQPAGPVQSKIRKLLDA